MHRSSNASQEYLVSGWLHVTAAQVSDGAASLHPRTNSETVRTLVILYETPIVYSRKFSLVIIPISVLKSTLWHRSYILACYVMTNSGYTVMHYRPA